MLWFGIQLFLNCRIPTKRFVSAIHPTFMEECLTTFHETPESTFQNLRHKVVVHIHELRLKLRQIPEVVEDSLVIGPYFWIFVRIFVVVEFVASAQMVVDEFWEYDAVGAYIVEVLVVVGSIGGEQVYRYEPFHYLLALLLRHLLDFDFEETSLIFGSRWCIRIHMGVNRELWLFLWRLLF